MKTFNNPLLKKEPLKSLLLFFLNVEKKFVPIQNCYLMPAHFKQNLRKCTKSII